MELSQRFPIHHVAIAVRSIDEAITRYTSDFFYQESPREVLLEFGAEVAFLLPRGGGEGVTAIELISPTESDGALSRFIERRGEGLHHICFQVHDVDSEHQRLKDEGYSFTSDSPRPGAHNGRVIFVHPKSFGGVLLELRSE